MYVTAKFTADDIKEKNKYCPGTIVEGYAYVVTCYHVFAEDGVIPEVYKQTDIAVFGHESDAIAYCESVYARDLDINSAIQYFYRVRCVEVD
jgi:hypothetical protein